MAQGIAKNIEAELARGRKISEARRRRKSELGVINTEETRRRISEAGRGRKASDATREKMSAAKKGKRPENFAAMQAKGHAMPKPTGADSPSWKGDAIGYGGLHAWVRKSFGAPRLCDRCGTTEAKRFEWANKSREYKRERDDWERLCVSCHRKDGYLAREYKTWNKGKKVHSNTGRTHFKPGQRSSTATEFRKGLTPWNKRLTPTPCAHCGNTFQPPDATRRFCSRRCYWDSMRQ